MKGLLGFRRSVQTPFTLVLLLAFTAVAHSTDTWDGRVLTMPSLSIGSATYSNVAVNMVGYGNSENPIVDLGVPCSSQGGGTNKIKDLDNPRRLQELPG